MLAMLKLTPSKPNKSRGIAEPQRYVYRANNDLILNDPRAGVQGKPEFCGVRIAGVVADMT